MPRKQAASSQSPGRHSLWLQGLVCGAMATLAAPTALLLAVLLGPALLALLFDREPGRPRVRGIALFCMAGAIAPLRALWSNGHSLAVTGALLSDPAVVATAWSAAALGWLLAEGTPLIVRAVLEAMSLTRTTRLQAERSRLIEAWGLEGPPGAQ
jgi:hypothetical protein